MVFLELQKKNFASKKGLSVLSLTPPGKPYQLCSCNFVGTGHKKLRHPYACNITSSEPQFLNWSISSSAKTRTGVLLLNDAEATFRIESPTLRTMMYSPHRKAPPANSTCNSSFLSDYVNGFSIHQQRLFIQPKFICCTFHQPTLVHACF